MSSLLGEAVGGGQDEPLGARERASARASASLLAFPASLSPADNASLLPCLPLWGLSLHIAQKDSGNIKAQSCYFA